MKPIIKIENLSKQYRLGTIGTGTLSHDLNRWWWKIRGKGDPILKIGETNKREEKGISEYVWALKDINMEVMPGEVVGIIGKNGAGKSTLLKILSKVTGPTTGSIKYNGRIGSLLEVGTGFHPELTGRENIFLNGAILGMTKQEIRSKLDEIVDFSGCERYIDTPVKRYSSGMKVRLGFAVAAHLEPEILVVDEVLAVGDAEFQKKAIGKMQDVSKNDGRTVLFVSHNMAAVRGLCQNGIVLKNGNVSFVGSADESVLYYIKGDNIESRKTVIKSTSKYRKKIPTFAQIVEVGFYNERDRNIYATREVIDVFFRIKGSSDNEKVRISGSVFTAENVRVGIFFGKEEFYVQRNKEVVVKTSIIGHNLSIGEYYLSFSVGKGDHTIGNTEYDILYEVLRFEVVSEYAESNDSNIVKWNSDWGSILFKTNTEVLD